MVSAINKLELGMVCTNPFGKIGDVFIVDYYIHTYIQTDIHAYIHPCMHTYIHTYTHTHIYIYIHIIFIYLFHFYLYLVCHTVKVTTSNQGRIIFT